MTKVDARVAQKSSFTLGAESPSSIQAYRLTPVAAARDKYSRLAEPLEAKHKG